MKHWLIKSEPTTFGFAHLLAAPKKTTSWEGVRNYQARNFMRDEMKRGDLILFYHSNCSEPGITGIAEVAREAYPDPTALDRRSKYFDPKSTVQNPIWVMVDIRAQHSLERPVSLQTLRQYAATDLKGMLLLQTGSRLSITPVSPAHFEFIVTILINLRVPGTTPSSTHIVRG